MNREVYLVVEYNSFIANPTEHIVGAFTTKEKASHQVDLINNWNESDGCELSAKILTISLDEIYC